MYWKAFFQGLNFFEDGTKITQSSHLWFIVGAEMNQVVLRKSLAFKMPYPEKLHFWNVHFDYTCLIETPFDARGPVTISLGNVKVHFYGGAL